MRDFKGIPYLVINPKQSLPSTVDFIKTTQYYTEVLKTNEHKWLSVQKHHPDIPKLHTYYPNGFNLICTVEVLYGANLDELASNVKERMRELDAHMIITKRKPKPKEWPIGFLRFSNGITPGNPLMNTHDIKLITSIVDETHKELKQFQGKQKTPDTFESIRGQVKKLLFDYEYQGILNSSPLTLSCEQTWEEDTSSNAHLGLKFTDARGNFSHTFFIIE